MTPPATLNTQQQYRMSTSLTKPTSCYSTSNPHANGHCHAKDLEGIVAAAALHAILRLIKTLAQLLCQRTIAAQQYDGSTNIRHNGRMLCAISSTLPACSSVSLQYCSAIASEESQSIPCVASKSLHLQLNSYERLTEGPDIRA